MVLGDYLNENNLEYCEVILKKENGEVIEDYGCLIQYCEVLEVNGSELTIG